MFGNENGEQNLKSFLNPSFRIVRLPDPELFLLKLNFTSEISPHTVAPLASETGSGLH